MTEGEGNHLLKVERDSREVVRELAHLSHDMMPVVALEVVEEDWNRKVLRVLQTLPKIAAVVSSASVVSCLVIVVSDSVPAERFLAVDTIRRALELCLLLGAKLHRGILVNAITQFELFILHSVDEVRDCIRPAIDFGRWHHLCGVC